MNGMIVPWSAEMPHLVFTVLMALAISGVIALLGKRSRRDRIFHAGWLFVSCVASVVAGSWIMYLVHG